MVPSARFVPLLAALLVASSSAQVELTFDGHNLPLFGGTFELLVHDWTGDGVPDLIGGHASANRVSFSVGLGDGRFLPPVALDVQAPRGLTQGDVNGDGVVDALVVDANGSFKDVRAFLGDGLGGFAEVRSTWFDDWTLEPQALEVVDVNGDGDLDLVALIFPTGSSPQFPIGYITTLLGDGSGLFVPTGLVRNVGELGRSMTSADFNGDGHVDVAVANNGSDDVTIRFGDATGSFVASSTFPVMVQPRGLAVADFDQDGHVDVLVGTSLSGQVGVLSGDGAGGFGFASYSAPSVGYVVTAGDVNGDGWADIVAGAGGPAVLLNDQLGGFLAPVTSYLPNTGALAVEDLDGDGNADLVVGQTTSGVTLLPGDGSGSFAALVQYDETVGWMRTADLDGDGDLDLVYQRDDVGGIEQLSVRLSNGDGTLAAETNVSTPFDSVAAEIVDWNGDGLLDLVSLNLYLPAFHPLFPSEQSLTVYVGDGTGQFTVLGDELLLATTPGRIGTGDVDGDGQLDLVLTSDGGVMTVHHRAPSGGVGVGIPLPFTSAGGALLVADVTNDGSVDVVTSNGSLVEVRANDGLGSFAAPVSHDAGSIVFELRMADTNGDGRRDLVTLNAQIFATYLTTLQALPGGGFAAPLVSANLSNSFAGGASSFDLGDVTGDGVLDAVVGGGRLLVLEGLAGGGWAAPVAFTGYAGALALADLDSDGAEDVVVASLDLLLRPNRALVPEGVRTFGSGTPGCEGVHRASTNGTPDLGSTTFAYACNHAPANSIGLLAGSQNGIEAGALVLGILAHVNPAGPLFRLDVVASDANGLARYPLVLPSDPVLAGATYVRQFVWAWPSAACSPSPLGWSTSRAVEVTLR